MLRAPGEVWSKVVCPASSHSGSGHDGDEARRRRASAVVEDGARGREQGKRAKRRQQELTGRTMRWSASSGASLVLRIERRRSPAVAMKMVVMAALQRVRGVVACRGGRGRRDGARRHSEGSRGRRWPRRYGGAAAAALGLERERERKRGKSSGESERAVGAAWRRPGRR